MILDYSIGSSGGDSGDDRSRCEMSGIYGLDWPMHAVFYLTDWLSVLLSRLCFVAHLC